MLFNHNTKAQGSFKVSVVDAVTGVVKRALPRQQNLILDAGLDQLATRSWFGCMTHIAVGTGTTPTKVAVDGTASQTGTTVTLSGSSYSFVSGDVGSWLKWSSGAEAKITAFTDATTVTVSPSQSVSSGSLVGLFRCNQTALATEVKRAGGLNNTATIWPSYVESDGNNSQGYSWNATTGVITLRRTIDQTAESGTVVYTEAGVSWSASAGNLFSRVVFDTPVTVNNGEKIRVQYNLQLTIPYASTSERPTNDVNIAISGWPYPYTITSITSTGAGFTVTLSATHHYIAGSKINIAGTSVGGYNAEWTVASITSTTVVVTSAANLGSSSGGTCTGNTKANIYQYWYPIQGIGPQVTNLSAGSGWPSTNGLPNSYSWTSAQSSLWDGSGTGSPTEVDTFSVVPKFYIPTSRITPGGTIASLLTLTAGVMSSSNVAAAYTNGNFYRDYTAVFASGSATATNIRTLFVSPASTLSSGQSYGGILIDFQEVQRKDSIAALNLTFRRSWSRVLA